MAPLFFREYLRNKSKRRLLYTLNPLKFHACQAGLSGLPVVGVGVLVCGRVRDQCADGRLFLIFFQ